METALLLVPAPAVPVAPQVGGQPRNNHDMTDARLDPRVATWADVGLSGLVGLDGADGGVVEHQPKNPHATNASVSTTNTTTSTMSAADRF